MSTTSRRHARHVAVAVAALALAAVAAPALGAANYGADTCLEGYVWRGAIPTDHVCVTPLVRMQTWQENDQAAVHRSPNGGPYGADTCLTGYVWREAVAERPRLRDPPAPPAGTQRQRPGRRAPRHRACLDHLLPPSQQPCTGNPSRRPRTTPSASACARPHQPGHGDRAAAPDRHGPRQGLAPAGRRQPERARRAARVRQRDLALHGQPRTRTWRCATRRRGAGRPASACARAAPRSRGPLGAPPALREEGRRRSAMPGSDSSGEEWRCLGKDAAAGLWHCRVWRRARLSRLEGSDHGADRAPLRPCGSPVCRGCG